MCLQWLSWLRYHNESDFICYFGRFCMFSKGVSWGWNLDSRGGWGVERKKIFQARYRSPWPPYKTPLIFTLFSSKTNTGSLSWWNMQTKTRELEQETHETLQVIVENRKKVRSIESKYAEKTRWSKCNKWQKQRKLTKSDELMRWAGCDVTDTDSV